MISATLACIDYLRLQKDIEIMDAAGADFYHIDIMDGHYVPNLCLNFEFIDAVRTISKTQMDVHLMVTNPFDYIQRLKKSGVEYISGHINLLKDKSLEFINKTHETGMKVGLVLSPDDSVKSVLPYIEHVDYIVILFVNPGFYGQQFMSAIISKVEELKRIRDEKNLNFLIEADGGINWNNIELLTRAGIDITVAGVLTIFNRKENLYDATVKFRELSNKQW